MRENKTFILLSIFGHLILQSYCQTRGTLIIEIESFRNDDGQVAISIHSGEEGFPGGHETMVQAKYAKIKDGKAIAEFDNLLFGEYGVSAYHDENANEKLDTNWLGIPKEGTGASNNAKGKMGPPKYEDAKFDFKADRQKIYFDIDYF
ncbi:MAG: DUF2141 domain-containing protein [Bacteroidales bacterium]|nr:DUF2141 domain-containing protein [Bacteroidales bacterium]